MIALQDYWMGREKLWRPADSIKANAAVTVERVNRLLALYVAATGDDRPRGINSGWRPREINAQTPGAAPKSRHMTGQAIDIADKSGALKKWLITNEGFKALEDCELWIERPSSTPTWVHFQTVPPKSGRRVFTP